MQEAGISYPSGAPVFGDPMQCYGRHEHRGACADAMASRLQVPCQANGHHYHSASPEQWHPYANGKWKDAQLDPEYWKTALSVLYAMFVCGLTAFVMVIVHERVPDMRTYPPLPDIFLDR